MGPLQEVFMVFNATFNNISVILWRSVLLVEETGVPRENHRPVAITDKLYQTLLNQNDLLVVPCWYVLRVNIEPYVHIFVLIWNQNLWKKLCWSEITLAETLYKNYYYISRKFYLSEQYWLWWHSVFLMFVNPYIVMKI
jgi:hypothetical protein